MTTQRKPYVREMTPTWWQRLVFLPFLYAARRDVSARRLVQHRY
jgi:fumarate reductase subunit C